MLSPVKKSIIKIHIIWNNSKQPPHIFLPVSGCLPEQNVMAVLLESAGQMVSSLCSYSKSHDSAGVQESHTKCLRGTEQKSETSTHHSQGSHCQVHLCGRAERGQNSENNWMTRFCRLCRRRMGWFCDVTDLFVAMNQNRMNKQIKQQYMQLNCKECEQNL